jgi:hypothetical protein
VKDFSAMTKTSFADSGALMSPRTAKYVEALMREGDNFDYQKWLQQVREEDAQAKRVPVSFTSGAPVADGCPRSGLLTSPLHVGPYHSSSHEELHS